MNTAHTSNEEIMELLRQCLPLFAALNDEKRQEIILIIAAAKEEGIMVNAITEKVKLSRPAVSHHLKVLKQTGIVGVKKNGVESYYYLTLLDSVKRFKELIAEIENSCILA